MMAAFHRARRRRLALQAFNSWASLPLRREFGAVVLPDMVGEVALVAAVCGAAAGARGRRALRRWRGRVRAVHLRALGHWAVRLAGGLLRQW